MSLIRARSSGLLPKLRQRYLYGALTGVAMSAMVLFAAVPAASAASSAKPARAMAVSAAQAGGQSLVHPTARPSSPARPDIVTESCNRKNLTWVHLFRLDLQHICLGNKGTVAVAGSETAEFCAGNNEGSFKYHYPGRPNLTQNFGPGYVLGFSGMNGATVVQVTITGWSGSAKCN